MRVGGCMGVCVCEKKGKGSSGKEEEKCGL